MIFSTFKIFLRVTYQIIFLTIRIPIQRIKRLALQINRTLLTCKTPRMVDLIHRSTTAILPHHFLAAFHTHPIDVTLTFAPHPLD